MNHDSEREKRVIISLGGGLNTDDTPNDRTVTRLEMTLNLYNTGRYPYIITTSRGTFRDPYPHSITEADASKKWLINKGIDPEVILTEKESLDTLGNAYFSRLHYLDPKGLKRPTVVTNEFHLKRAELLFGLVLGKGYNPNYVGVDNIGLLGEDLKKRRQHERFMSFFYLWYFDGIKRGDMEVFKHYIEQHNPAYTKRVNRVHEELTKVITEIWRT